MLKKGIDELNNLTEKINMLQMKILMNEKISKKDIKDIKTKLNKYDESIHYANDLKKQLEDCEKMIN